MHGPRSRFRYSAGLRTGIGALHAQSVAAGLRLGRHGPWRGNSSATGGCRAVEIRCALPSGAIAGQRQDCTCDSPDPSLARRSSAPEKNRFRCSDCRLAAGNGDFKEPRRRCPQRCCVARLVGFCAEPDQPRHGHRGDVIRILALTTDSTGSPGGIAQYNRDFVEAISGADGDFGITILPRVGPARGISKNRVREEKPLANRVLYSLRAILHGFGRFDIVFCAHLNLAAVGAAAAELSGARFVVQTHGVEAWSCPSALIRKSVEAADLVLAVSRFTRARVLSWASIPPERVLVLSNTVDRVFTPGNGAALRAAWGLDGKIVL